MVTQESEISAPRSCNWHCKHRAKASGNKHCKWASHMVRTTLLYELSASRLLLSDLPLPSINLMMWQRARLIKLNYFCSHFRLTVMQHRPSCSWFRTGQASVSRCWTTLYNWEIIFRIYLIQKDIFFADENKLLSCTDRFCSLAKY